MFIPRERSIWYATKNPSASNPFNFVNDISGVGSSTPDAITRVLGGIVFPDFRQQEIYYYTGPKELKSLTKGKVRRSIFNGISDPTNIYASFDSVNLEWTLFVPSSDETYVTMWRYNFRKDTWTFDEYTGPSCVVDVDRSSSSLAIDELPSTMDSLVGSFNDLSDPSSAPPQRLLGRSDGEIVTVVDGENVSDYPSLLYESQLEGKVHFLHDDRVLLFQEIYFTVYTDTAGDVVLDYSKDEGKSWTVAKSFTIGSAHFGKPIKLKWKKPLRAERFQWRLRTSNCNIEILDHTLMVEAEGEKQQTTGVS
jgi:hypothetical protein